MVLILIGHGQVPIRWIISFIYRREKFQKLFHSGDHSLHSNQISANSKQFQNNLQAKSIKVFKGFLHATGGNFIPGKKRGKKWEQLILSKYSHLPKTPEINATCVLFLSGELNGITQINKLVVIAIETNSIFEWFSCLSLKVQRKHLSKMKLNGTSDSGQYQVSVKKRLPLYHLLKQFDAGI